MGRSSGYAFLILTLIQNADLAKGDLQLCLTISMLMSFFGMGVGMWKRKTKRFATSAGMYLFGAGTLFMIVQRLQMNPHMVKTQEQYPSSQLNTSNSSTSTALTRKQQTLWVEFSCRLVGLLFTILQILFLQAFWKPTFNKSGWSRQFMKFTFFHTSATNICIWLLYTAEEVHIFDHYGHSKHWFCSNSTKDAFVELAQSFEAYLVPFTLECSLIAAGILFGMASRMRYFDSNDTGTDEANENNEQDTDQVDDWLWAYDLYQSQSFNMRQVE